MAAINAVKLVKHELHLDGSHTKNILHIRIVHNFLFEKHTSVVDCGAEKDTFKLDG